MSASGLLLERWGLSALTLHNVSSADADSTNQWEYATHLVSQNRRSDERCISTSRVVADPNTADSLRECEEDFIYPLSNAQSGCHDRHLMHCPGGICRGNLEEYQVSADQSIKSLV